MRGKRGKMILYLLQYDPQFSFKSFKFQKMFSVKNCLKINLYEEYTMVRFQSSFNELKKK